MNPNIPQDIQNNISINTSNTNQIIPNQNIKNITIIKTEEQKQINDINTNTNTNYIPNNLENNQNIIKETKIVTQTINNPMDPQRFSFSDVSNLNLVSLENANNNHSYRQLIKKIANQLKRKVRPPTQGFFHFALQKGDYSLIIIRKISSQMRNHQIEFNNDIFRIYTQKLVKYRELIKRIAHLLKITMKNKKYFENLNNKVTTTVQTIEKTTIVQTNTNTNTNLNKATNVNKNNEIKKASVKSEQVKLVGNNKNIVNQKKIKTQTITQTNLNKSHITNKSSTNQTNRYNSNINHNRINPTNPFFASKDKLSFNSSNTNMIKNNLQNQNQYFLHNKEKTTVSNNNSKSPITQNITLNKNKNMININLNKQQNNINNINSTQNEAKIIKTEITTTNNITNNINNNKMDIIQEEIKPKMDLEVINKEKIIVPNIEEKKVISNNIHQETHNIINSISNNNEINTINNYNISENRIFSKNPINSVFTDTSNDIEMKNSTNTNNNINILSEKNQNTNIINTSLINTGTFQQIPKNNIEANKNININFEKKSINVNLINNSKDKNIINTNESNTNVNNMSMNNNYNSDTNNNITITSLNKEEDKNYYFTTESIKSKGKQIKIRLSPFKKETNKSFIEEEKSVHSNMGSQTININNIQNLNCNTFTENDINNNLNNDDSIIFQKEISTYPDESTFLKKFDTFLSKKNIFIQSNIPMAVNNNGQQYLKQNAFWEKYLNYIFINHSVNNAKISLFSFAHLIEQYFLWCENLSSDIVEGFKKSIIDIILKIYTTEEVNQFCTMNKIKSFGDIFEKYKSFIKDKNGSFKYDKEIEIKIKNKDPEECDCELCKNEIACMKKLIEVNKNKIIGVNIESIFYDGNENKIKNKKDEEDEDEEIYIKKTKKTYPPTKSRNSSGKKKSYSKFSASKIKESSGGNIEYIGKERSKSKKRTSSSKKKRQSSKGKRSSSRHSINKKEKKIEEEEDMKIDDFLVKEADIKELEEIIADTIDNNIKKKGKNKKKEKSKSRSKSKEEKYESNSESEEKETKNKKNKKKQKSKNKKKEKKNSDSESEDEKVKTKDKKKKKQQYPKD